VFINDQIILSIDVEDWQQSTWDRNLPIRKRAADNVLYLLEILEKYDLKSTMFVLGKFCEKFPEIVKQIHKNGHEIACHGYGHIEIFNQGNKNFKLDVKRSKDMLEQLIGEPVIGYRAPDFSIIKKSLWALEILSELGFKYDSSIYPIHHKRYGIADWDIGINNVIINDNLSIIEFPLSIYNIGKLNIPVSGGGYFRLLPINLFIYFVKQIIKKRPFIFYMHPYEMDYNEFHNLEFEVPLLTRIHQGFGRKSFLHKLEVLLNNFSTTTFLNIVNNKRKPFTTLNIHYNK